MNILIILLAAWALVGAWCSTYVKSYVADCWSTSQALLVLLALGPIVWMVVAGWLIWKIAGKF